MSTTTSRSYANGGHSAGDRRRDEVGKAVERALRPIFSTLGEAFGIVEDRQLAFQHAIFSTLGEAFGMIEDRQLALQQSIDDIRRRLDSGKVHVRANATPAPPSPGSESALQRIEALLSDIRDQLTLGDVFSQVEQPLPPAMEHLFNRLEDSQAMMEKLIGELAMRVGVSDPGNRRTPQPW